MPVDPLPPGTLLCIGGERRHRYKLSEQEPTASGFALIYRAQDRRLGCDVRIKEVAFDEVSYREVGGEMIRPRQPELEELQRLLLHRVEHEVRALGRVFSSNVARIGDFWREWGTAYCTLEERPGALPLFAWQAPHDRSRWEAVRPIVSQLLDGLEAIHAVGLVQGDLRPETVSVDSSGTAVVADLGHARADFDLMRRFQTSPWTKDFAAPELYAPKSATDVGPWSDLYAWALIAYGLMVGHPTPTGRPVSAFDRYQAEAYDDAAATLLRAGVPESWANAIHRCLLLEADRRPRTVGDVKGMVQGSAPAVNLDWEAIARESQEAAEATRVWAQQVSAQLEQTQARAGRAERRANRLILLVLTLIVGVLALVAVLVSR